ncbi:AMP-binding protein [Burkholderia gladioli]|uniref:AMP-binding protein n=1 Tax=Burkholderia gladioli TaxID=28095 RepID=UPI0016415DFE|nr:AMP-binding protein [Burkholderia gladioli]
MPTDPLSKHELSFFDVVEQRAAVDPERSAYIVVGADGRENTRLTYGALHRRVEAYANAIDARGIEGARALMLYEPGIEFVVAFLGCLRAGVIVIPANIAKPGRTSWDRLVAIVRDSDATHILTEHSSVAKLRGWFATNTVLSALDLLCLENDSASAGVRRVRPTDDTPAFLQYTSGSTGDPKGTVVTFGNLAANAALAGPAIGIDHDSRIVTWLPPYHDLGLIGNILQSLWAGAECILMPPVSFVQNPARWLETIERYHATVSMAPNFAYELCVRRIPASRRRNIDLSSWRVALNSAEPIRASAIHRFREAFRDSGFEAHGMRAGYGLAEATLVVSTADPDKEPVMLSVDARALDQGRIVPVTAARSGREIVSSGIVRMPQRVRIINPDTYAGCAADEVGEIWIHGPCVAHGYWNRPEETQRTFGAFTADGDGPFLRTGDLGAIVDGELYVTGRIKEVIIVRGRKLYPQDIEATVQRAHDALRPAGGAAFAVEGENAEELVIVQEIERAMLASIDRQELISIISDAVYREHGVAIAEVVLVKPEVVPKTSSGKVQRVLCRALHARGELERVVQGRLARTSAFAVKASNISPPTNAQASAEHIEAMPGTESDSIVAVVAAWMSDNGLNAPSDPLQTFAELGVDSMRSVELALHLETRLGIAVDQTILYEYPTVDSLAKALQLRTGRLGDGLRVVRHAV